MGTYGGIARFNPKGTPSARVAYAGETAAIPPMFTVIVPDDQDRRAKAITILLEDRSGAVWCGTLKGLYKLERGNQATSVRSVDIGIPTEYSEQADISDLIEDRNGSLWIAAPSGLYRRWPQGRAARYTAKNGLPSEHLSDLLEDHQGRLWAGTPLGGFFRLVTDATETPPAVANPDPSIKTGSNLTYTLYVTNSGPQTATGVTVTDTLPASVSFVSANATKGSCSGTSTVT